MVLEYLSGNALKKYPFDDSVSLISNGAYQLTNDCILDLLYFQHLSEPYSAYLSNFTNDIVGHNIVLSFNMVDSNGSPIGSTVISTIPHSSITAYNTVSTNLTNTAIKYVVGPGLVNIVNAGEAIDETFTISTAKLNTSAVIQNVPRVTSLNFYNNDSLLTSVTDAFSLQGGANTTFSEVNNLAAIDVTTGSGAGLFNACDNDLYIKSINAIGPNSDNNFLLNTDDCYTTEPIINGLSIDNICTPRCTQAQMAAFQHYLNRVKNGTSELATYAADLSNSISTAVSGFSPDNDQYYKVAWIKQPATDSGYYYYSVAIAVLNPANLSVSTTINVALAGGVGVYIPASGKWITDNSTTLIAEITSNTFTVPCLKVGTEYFTIYGKDIVDATTMTISGTVGDFPIGYVATLI